MKTILKTTIIIKAVFTVFLLTSLSSCEEEAVNDPVDTEEVAEILAGSMARDAQGMTLQMESSAETAEIYITEASDGGRTANDSVCDQQYSSTFDRSSAPGQRFSYTYSFEYDYTFSCNQFLIPSQADFSMVQSGQFDSPNFGSTNSTNGGWTLSGLQPSATEYTFAGDFGRSGQHVSKVRNQKTYEFELTIMMTDVKMTKGTYEIALGTASYSISGSDSFDNSFAVQGSMEFLGNQQILININDNSFIINLGTGDVEPA